MKLFHKSRRFPSCVKSSANCYNGSPHTSQSFPPFAFSKVQCGHTRTAADVRLSPPAGVATSSNNSGGMSSSVIRLGGASGAGRAGGGAVVKRTDVEYKWQLSSEERGGDITRCKIKKITYGHFHAQR